MSRADGPETWARRVRPSLSGSRRSSRSSIPQTRALKAHIQELFAAGELRLKDKIKREFHQSVIEVGTGICRTSPRRARTSRTCGARSCGSRPRTASRSARPGRTPSRTGRTSRSPTNPRYEQIVYDLGVVARGNLIFGLHVHVAVEHDETRIALQNAARYFLPHIFALSTNSPFWCGRNTGWKSYRAKVFERFPRTGIPD